MTYSTDCCENPSPPESQQFNCNSTREGPCRTWLRFEGECDTGPWIGIKAQTEKRKHLSRELRWPGSGRQSRVGEGI